MSNEKAEKPAIDFSTKILIVHLPANIHRDLKLTAAKREMSMSEIVVGLVESFLSESKNRNL